MADKKLTEDMILDAFEYRGEVGKCELTAAEIADIISAHILEDDTVSRQAVHYRLDKHILPADDPPIVKVERGNMTVYHLEGDTSVFGVERDTLEKIKNMVADGGAMSFPMSRRMNPLTAVGAVGVLATTLGASAAVTVFIGITAGYTPLFYASGVVMVLSLLSSAMVFVWANRRWGRQSLTPVSAFGSYRDTAGRGRFGKLLERLDASPDFITDHDPNGEGGKNDDRR